MFNLKPDTYRTQQPTFDLHSVFDDQVTAYGIVQNHSGQVIQRFEVDIQGTVQDNVLTLDEDFVYTLGEGRESGLDHRTAGRRIFRQRDGCTGPALGEPYGNAFRFPTAPWTYCR